jgi:flagellar secretion chaperone FliS
MNPHLKYKTVQSYSWTRVDMLILVYDQAVSALSEGARLLEQNRKAELPAVKLRAMKTLLAIAEGLNLQRGELPIQVLRLVVFALDQVRIESAEAWRSAESVISTLRAGFLEIQDDARKDEYEGRIPALDAVN